MAFGSGLLGLCPLSLDGNHLEWVQSWKYLAVVLLSGEKFNCCIDEKLKNFYKCLNSILRIEGRSGELVMLQLLEAHCVPILTYGIEIIHVTNTDTRRKLRVAYNAIFRKIFNYRYGESVRELQAFLERPTWEKLVEDRCNRFQSNLANSRIPIVRF